MGRADLERAKELFPSCDMGKAGWVSFFSTAEGEAAVGKLLYDIYDEVLAAEERHAGTHKMGRRARRDPVSLDEVYGIVFPQQYNNEPLAVVVRRYIASTGESQKAFAARIPADGALLSRNLTGHTEPKLDMLEAIAKAMNVKPWYLVEWRAAFLGALVTETLLKSPHLSITAVKNMRGTRTTPERP